MAAQAGAMMRRPALSCVGVLREAWIAVFVIDVHCECFGYRDCRNDIRCGLRICILRCLK